MSGRARQRDRAFVMLIIGLVGGLLIAALATLVGALASQATAEVIGTTPSNVRFGAYVFAVAILVLTIGDVRDVARRRTYFEWADVLTYVCLGICYATVGGSVLVMGLFAEQVATAVAAEVDLVRWIAAAAAVMFLVGSIFEWRAVVRILECGRDAAWSAELDEVHEELDEILDYAGVGVQGGLAGVEELADRYNDLVGRPRRSAGGGAVDGAFGSAVR